MCLSSIDEATLGLSKPTSTTATKSLDTRHENNIEEFYIRQVGDILLLVLVRNYFIFLGLWFTIESGIFLENKFRGAIRVFQKLRGGGENLN